MDSNTPHSVKKQSYPSITKYVGFIFIFAVHFSTTAVHAASTEGRSTIPTATLLDAIARSNAPKPIKAALRKDISYKPQGNSIFQKSNWAGNCNEYTYALSVFRHDPNVESLSIATARAYSFRELIYYGYLSVDKSITPFLDTELSPASLLRCYSGWSLHGRFKNILHDTKTIDKWAITVSYCNRDALTAELKDTENLSALREFSGTAGLQRLKTQKFNKNWDLASNTWNQLKEHNLVTPEAVIEYGDCLIQQNENDKAIKHFNDYLLGYGHILDVSFFMRIVDLLEPLANTNKKAEQTAIKAYDKADRILLSKPKTIKPPNQINAKP